jgi:hypothetical protein
MGFQTPPLEKERATTHETSPFFLGHQFSFKRARRPILEFDMKKDVLFVYRVRYKVRLIILEESPTLGALINRCSRAFV